MNQQRDDPEHGEKQQDLLGELTEVELRLIALHDQVVQPVQAWDVECGRPDGPADVAVVSNGVDLERRSTRR